MPYILGEQLQFQALHDGLGNIIFRTAPGSQFHLSDLVKRDAGSAWIIDRVGSQMIAVDRQFVTVDPKEIIEVKEVLDYSIRVYLNFNHLSWGKIKKFSGWQVMVTWYRWMIPRFVPFIGGHYIGFVSSEAKLSVRETKNGTRFSHPGFKGGELEVPIPAFVRSPIYFNGGMNGLRLLAPSP
jgi:hypothetical protein